MTDHAFTITVDEGVHAALVADAHDAQLPPEKLVSDLLRQHYTEAGGSAEYQAWFRREVEAAVREADDPNTVWVSNKEVEAQSRIQRAEFRRRAALAAS